MQDSTGWLLTRLPISQCAARSSAVFILAVILGYMLASIPEQFRRRNPPSNEND